MLLVRRELFFAMGALCGCFDGLSAATAQKPERKGNEFVDSVGSSRQRFAAYIDQTIKRLDAVDASDSKLQTCIEPTVVASLKRLSAGAPADIRNQLVAQLRCNNVLNHTATKEEFRAALLACQAIVGHTPAEKPAPCGPEPTENELKTLTGVLGRLWSIDEPHRLVEGQDYSLNPQSRASYERLGDETRSFGEGDMAQGPLFSHVNEKKMFGAPCTKAFFDLMDNYEVGDDRAEEVSEKEQQEMDIFMHDLMQTPHMRYVHKVLQSWVNVDADEHVFSAEVLRGTATHCAESGLFGISFHARSLDKTRTCNKSEDMFMQTHVRLRAHATNL